MNAIDGTNRGIQLLVLLFVIPLMGIGLCGCGSNQAREAPVEMADVIMIDHMERFGSLDRPPVPFPHDAHTAKMEDPLNSCDKCHPSQDDGRRSLRYLRVVNADIDADSVMEIYHINCVKCHDDTRAKKMDSGPVICGECHMEQPAMIPGQALIGFDKSLHHRHTVAMGEDCGKCHHKYNEETKELYYAKGEESSCRDCHHETIEEDVPSLRQAGHWACIGCHVDLAGEGGPYKCAGCHDSELQKQFKVVENPMRLKRGQPDFTLLSTTAEQEFYDARMNTVPFSHAGHEQFNSTCRVCHHETMKGCDECHSLAGKYDGKGVTLQQAMHSMNSGHSCVGCHDREKEKPECAGCHALMQQGKLSEHSCTICHAGPSPDIVERVRGRYNSINQFRSEELGDGLSFRRNEIPDTVVIGILSNQYEPARFPHRKITMKLLEHISDSRIATYFHGNEDVVCQGCHHYSPIGQTPPLCQNCHGEPFDEDDLHKPGLYGAYHRQCIGCHQYMNFENPSDCAVCHQKKKSVG
ncbi:MAG: cytochrome C [candidate division Zixibacteria bacterium]|nr:cytochrome C [candidate division Zixibacteria bacterium]